MLPKRLRLSRAAFPAVSAGVRGASTHFSYVATKTPGRSGCAAVVSKKVAKRSVDRHLLKRRMLSVAEEFCTPGRSLIVYARAGSLSLPFSTLKKELGELLNRLPV